MSTSLQSYEFGSPTRRNVFLAILLCIGLAYTGRLVQLQIIEGSDYRLISETQAIKQLVVEPVRGSMYDRNGKLIVNNSPSFSVQITPKDFREESLPALEHLLGLTEKEIRSRMAKAPSRFVSTKILRDADFSIIAAIEENRAMFPGVNIVAESKRIYNFQGNSAHLLGYTKEINERQLQTRGDYYRQGDIIGATGLEASYENFLRGQKGVEFAAVNSIGQRVAQFNDGKNDITAEDGFDLQLGVDIGLQDYIEELMKPYKGGAVVAIDPSNGELLAFVSKPDYDLRMFSGKTPSNLYAALLHDSTKPMFNRAALTRYPPGSTWKMLMAIAALQEGIITDKTIINCPGSFTFGGRTWACHGTHGATDVRKAIHASCNVFFYHMGLKLGIEKFEYYGRMFGFGMLTGLDLVENQESKGLLPSLTYFNKVYPHGWPKGALVNLGIGQGEIGVTPLQMAVYTATIANRGTHIQPHAVRAIYNKKLGKLQPIEYESTKLPLNPGIWDVIIQGMYDVVNTPGGTARNARVDSLTVCGKTGTAQNPHGQDHSWFVCFAPRENPKIAICVMLENAGFGGTHAAPLAQKVMTKYFFPDRLKDADKDHQNGQNQQQAPTDAVHAASQEDYLAD